MAFGFTQQFEVGIASGASTSSTLDTGGRAFDTLAVKYEDMSTGAAVALYGANTSTATFLPISWKDQDAATYNALNIATSVSGGWGVLPCPPHRYIQFITSAVVSGGVSFVVLGNGG